jgi:hypothetical protein
VFVTEQVGLLGLEQHRGEEPLGDVAFEQSLAVLG